MYQAHFRTYGVNECQVMLQNEGLREVSIEGLREVSIERYKIDWFWGMMTAKAVKET